MKNFLRVSVLAFFALLTSTMAKADEVSTIFEETFSESQGEFTINDITLPEGLSYVWKFDSKYGMKATAYVSGTNYAAESELVSPEIDLTSASNITFSFDHARKYGDLSNLSVKVRCEGADTKLDVANWPDGSNWTFISSGDISLESFAGKKIQIVFDYTSTADGAATWEIKNVKVTGVGGTSSEEETTTKTAASVAELIANFADGGEDIALTLTNAQVVYKSEYKSKVTYYLREGDKAVMLYNTGLELNVGDILNGTTTVAYVLYNKNPEITSATSDGLTITSGTAAAREVAVADVENYLCDLVQVNDVTLKAEASGSRTNIYAYSGDNKVQVYDNFKLGILPDAESIDESVTYKISGIAQLYNGKYLEIYVTEVTNTSGISNINADAATLPAYNLAGQKVDAAYKGVVIRGGKKFIQ